MMVLIVLISRTIAHLGLAIVGGVAAIVGFLVNSLENVRYHLDTIDRILSSGSELVDDWSRGNIRFLMNDAGNRIRSLENNGNMN